MSRTSVRISIIADMAKYQVEAMAVKALSEFTPSGVADPRIGFARAIITAATSEAAHETLEG
jgi:hypothetical protein